MIGIKEINELMLQKQEKNKEFRFKSLHLSELAICGFKYRNSIENKLPINSISKIIGNIWIKEYYFFCFMID